MTEDPRQQARDAALTYLTSRSRSVLEVKRRLHQKGFEAEVVDAVIADLQRLRLLDDGAFAQVWIESRQRRRPMGSRRLAQELRQKGVDAQNVDEALAPHRATADSVEAAAGVLRGQAWRYRELEVDKARSRMLGFLARRGYDMGTAARAVASLLEEWTKR